MTHKRVFRHLICMTPTVTAAMWVICMTTNSNGCHMGFKKKVLYPFSLLKVIPQKNKFNIEYLLILSNLKLSKSPIYTKSCIPTIGVKAFPRCFRFPSKISWDRASVQLPGVSGDTRLAPGGSPP